MKTGLNRREFVWQASAGIGGLEGASCLGKLDAAALDRDPGEKRMMLLGLNALGRAHEMS